MLIVSTERNRYIQQHRDQTHAEAILPTHPPIPGRLRFLWKQWVTHDADGNPSGTERAQGSEVTILRVEGPYPVVDLDLQVAVGCGFRTAQAFHEDWDARHPRSPRASIVWFALGDWRDRDEFLAPSGHGSDYTTNPRRSIDAEASALTREQIDALSSVNHQKDDARRAEASRALANETPSRRLLRLELAVEKIRAEIGEEAARYIEKELRPHVRVITQRVEKAERAERRK